MAKIFPPTIDLHKPTFNLRICELFHFSPGANATHRVRNDQPRDPLDESLSLVSFNFDLTFVLQFPATSPLPPNRLRRGSSSSNLLPSGTAFFNSAWLLSDKGKKKAREPKQNNPKPVDVPLGQATYVCFLRFHWIYEF
jgi:hypothetical protein